jgi:hypothetical protein
MGEKWDELRFSQEKVVMLMGELEYHVISPTQMGIYSLMTVRYPL